MECSPGHHEHRRTLIEAAITDKTRVIVPVHYAGVACEQTTITALAKKHNLFRG
ncbi:DegT/DnrJ/EryC1/StrS family aminotransferase [Shigella flexneri]